MIVSFIPGRVRIRSNTLKDPSVMIQVVKSCTKLNGFISAQPNFHAGSMLLKYDSSKITTDTGETFLAYIKKTNPSIATHFHVAKTSNKKFNRAMAVAFAICMLSPAGGYIRLHKYSAFLFAGLSLKHMYDYKKRII